MYDGRVVVVDHPMVQHKLAILRDARTPSMRVPRCWCASWRCSRRTRRRATCRLSDAVVQTPHRAGVVAKTDQRASKVAFVPILRAGLGMVDGALEAGPRARAWGIWACSATRRRTSRERYYAKLPADIAARAASAWSIPMLATGGSAESGGASYLREAGRVGDASR